MPADSADSSTHVKLHAMTAAASHMKHMAIMDVSTHHSCDIVINLNCLHCARVRQSGRVVGQQACCTEMRHVILQISQLASSTSLHSETPCCSFAVLQYAVPGGCVLPFQAEGALFCAALQSNPNSGADRLLPTQTDA
jgi:hypothetical protein